jgi:Holliday junction resolvase RusA-like endonuclease
MYFKEVGAIIRQLGLHKENIAQSVVISLVLHPRTLARYDVSNFLKAYEDALVKAGFLEDDHWIEYGSIKKGDKIKGGLLEVVVVV